MGCPSTRGEFRCMETEHGVYEGSRVHVAYKENGWVALMWLDQSTPHWKA